MRQRGGADLKAMGTAGSGTVPVIAGLLDLNDVATIVAILVPVITLGVYIWATRRKLREQRRHNLESERIQREGL